MMLAGSALLLLAAALLSRNYAVYLKCRLSGCRSFLKLLRYMERRMSCYMDTPSAFARGYIDREGLPEGFLESLEKGERPDIAFGRVRGKSLLPEDAAEILEELFSGLGTEYLEREVMKVSSAASALEAVCNREETESEKRRRVFTAIILSLALGFIILII